MVRRRRGIALRGVLACALAALVLGAAASAATPVSDPFLERFRVGHLADPDSVVLDASGWPEGLFAPLATDSSWCAAAADYFARETLPQEHRWLTWRFAAPALGQVGAQRAWYDAVRADALALAASGESPLAGVRGIVYLRDALLETGAMRHLAAGDTAGALARIDALLVQADRLGLDDEEAFVWSLRRRALGGATDRTAPAADLWPELLDLGPFDARSGWAVWVAVRRHRGAPLLPPGCAGDARRRAFLAGLSDPGLSEADLDAAALPDDFHAALGAAVLPRGPALSRHLSRFPDPPASPREQAMWVGGVRRNDRYAASATERLAARADLDRTLRLDLWRRASERRVLAGEWTEGLSDLAEACDLRGRDAGRGEARRLDDWFIQMLAGARAHGRDGTAAALLRLARSGLDPDARDRFLAAAAAYGLLEGAPARAPQGRLERIRDAVLRGAADDLDGPGGVAADLDPPALRARLWDLWIALGTWLVDRAAAAGEAVDGAAVYGDALAAAARIGTPAARSGLGCAAVGAFLRSRPEREDVLEWLLACDVASAAGVPRPVSPLPDLSRGLGTGQEAALVRHALLGVALASGDPAGQLSLAVSLPQGPLAEDDRLLLLHPLPSSSRLHEAIAASGLPPSILLAIARNESAFEPSARSRAGALGWMQIMPFHYPDRGYTGGRAVWRDPRTSLDLGTRILRESADRLGGDPYRAVAAYNAGEGAVRRWDRQLGGSAARNEFLAWIGYPETRTYVEKVLIDRAIYDWILGGDPTAGP